MKAKMNEVTRAHWLARFRAQSEIKAFSLFVALEKKRMRQQLEAALKAEHEDRTKTSALWLERKKELLAKQAAEAAIPVVTTYT